MDMRLQNRDIMPEQPSGACRGQIVVEGEVTLPGSLRETADVLHASATAVVENAEAMQGRVNIGGRVTFCVLYAQGENHRMNAIEATADFTHLCELAGAVPRAEVTARAQVEQVDASVQNGRMTMRAVLRLCARTMNCEAMQVISGVGASGAQTQTTRMTMRRTVGKGSADVLLREEFDLPADLAIHDTLCAFASASFGDTAGGQGRIGLSGEVTIEAVHASDLPGKPLVTTRHTAPVSQSVEITGETGELLDGRIVVKDVAVASQDMGDGERTLRAEVLLGLSAWTDREESVELLTDAYTTSGDDLRLTRTLMTIRTGDNRMHAAESGKASVILPDGAVPVRTMLAAYATPVLMSCTQQGNRLIAEGTLKTSLVYLSQDGVPVSAKVDAPFRAAFSASAAPEDIVTLSAANVEATPITSDRVEMRYILQADVEGVQAETVSVVTEAAAVPAGAASPDIVLYFAQPGETAWDIARRYRIPESELRALNPDLKGEPQVGQGVVVWHRNAV